MKIILSLFMTIVVHTSYAQVNEKQSKPQVKVSDGILQGVYTSGISSFKGIPFAAPPIGQYRWREPQAVVKWDGVRKAEKFGPRAMQRPIFGDMNFRSDGVSEDCLYLNVWTPALSKEEKLPVLVYFYGGGFMAGDGSEPRYDGESMARRGIVAVTVNYRLNIFGFFAHPDLSKESPHHASGNYGLLDQYAALLWVKSNIAAFGGDPDKVTIAGESAGSFAVSAQMASPLAKNLFRAAIGESGALLGNRALPSLADAEAQGLAFAKSLKVSSLQALRDLTADQLLEATTKPEANFSVNIDGHFFNEHPVETFKKGEQARVPLLVGWNDEEMNYRAILGDAEPTIAHFTRVVKERFEKQATDLLALYKPLTDAEVAQVATDFASDQFIAYGTWRWADLHSQTAKQPIYRYLYERPRPAMRPEMGNAVAGLAGGVIKGDDAKKAPMPKQQGAVHSAEIEYALGNLPTNRVYDWQAEDYQVSSILQAYFENFIKSTEPNGLGVPHWPAIKSGEPAEVMHIDVETKARVEQHRDRYLLLEKLSEK